MITLGTSHPSRVLVYIDGLNLQRQLKVPKVLHWLDLQALCRELFPQHETTLIRYFTTKTKAFPGNQDMAIEQEIYWRALRTIGPKLEMHFGTMRSSPRFFPRYPLTECTDGGWERVKVLHTEEKGTDVALGSYMVADAASGSADLYALISNDSDFAPTLRILQEQLGAKCALVSPNGHFSNALLGTKPSITRVIREGVIEASQFPRYLSDQVGTFEAPLTWR